ncbi:hypothetical protein FA15DRAFT_755594 [Coprinopsis marcescibilis]|uniref:Uncharacterized protein n=1 Tax=Coprinopsis marcescibilis TaxID=230819 RepID=A0A5C3KZ51_COPMA|nr:hypothetical protein FA15DRAFT_755594 [Coprinopsis marcescibilis]
MPSSSRRRPHNRGHHERLNTYDSIGNGMAGLHVSIPETPEQYEQSPSPRSELLSPSTTDRRRERSSVQEGSSRRQHNRSSTKHRSRISDASHRELMRLVIDQETEAERLKETLHAISQRLDEETQKAAQLEHVSQESADRFRQLNESRLEAQQKASAAQQEARLYQLQLQNAGAEIIAAQQLAKQLEKEKEEAELSAARARAKARKLHQQQLVMRAREEGRKLGFDAGIKQAQEEYIVSSTAKSRSRSSRPGRRHIERTDIPSATSQLAEHHPEEEYTFDDDGVYDDHNSVPTIDVLNSPEVSHSRRPSHSVGLQSRMPVPVSAPAPAPTPGPSTQPVQSTSSNINRTATPGVEIYSIPIPAVDQSFDAEQQPRDAWVTAQEHRVRNNVEATPPGPSPHPQGQRFASTGQPAVPPPPPPRSAPVPASVPPPAPAPIIVWGHPSQSQPPSASEAPRKASFAAPPKGSDTSRKKPSRVDSLKTWYRSLSLRKKTKPVIDPGYEEPPRHTQPWPTTVGAASTFTDTLHPNSVPGPSTQPNPTASDDGESESKDLYRYQPEPPMSWYSKSRPSDARSQKSRKSFLHPGGDGDARLSRASTRLSDIDMLSNAPPGRRMPEGSISGRSLRENTNQLAQKLSVIKEDPLSRGNTPQVDRLTAGNPPVAGFSRAGPIPAPQFTSRAMSEVGSARSGRKRPSEIAVPPPAGIPNNPFMLGNYHLYPSATPPIPTARTQPSSINSGSINIDIQPATAAVVPQSAFVPPPIGTHLSPNYQYETLRFPQRSPSNASRKSRSSQAKGHRVAQSVSDPPLPVPPPADAHYARSNHSRSASVAQDQGIYDTYAMGHPDRHRSRAAGSSSAAAQQHQQPQQSPYHHSRTGSTHSFSHQSQNPNTLYAPPGGTSSSQHLEDPKAPGLRHSPSRSSMHSKFQTDNYLDPAYFAPEGPNPNRSPNRYPQHLSPNMGAGAAHQRSPSPGLEYLDP